MKQSLIDNIKHLPSTLFGLGVALMGLPSIPQVQQLTGINPALASKLLYVAAAGAVLQFIFGTGKK
jgi:hypothetical protein